MSESSDEQPLSITAVTSGYTPGPWRIDWRNQGSFAIRAAGKTVCAGNYVYTPAPLAAHHANARLISAAPDLLAELKWCFMGAGSLQRMAAAIAKAEGRAPPAKNSADDRLSEAKECLETRDETNTSKLSGGWEPIETCIADIKSGLCCPRIHGCEQNDGEFCLVRLAFARAGLIPDPFDAPDQDHAPVRGREGSVDLQTNVALQCADPQAGRSGGEP